MTAIFKIINKNYWMSVFGPLATFVIPIIFSWLVCCVYSFTTNNGQTDLGLILGALPSTLLMAPYCLTLIMFPQAVYEIKDSIFMKRLQCSTVKVWKFLLVAFSYYAVCAIISYCIGVASSVAVVPTEMIRNSVLSMFATANIGDVMYTCIINVAVGLSIGMLVASLSKNPTAAPLTGLTIILVSIALAGFLTPITLGKLSNKTLWSISYVDPIRYSCFLSFESWFSKPCEMNAYGSNIFDLSAEYCSSIASNIHSPVVVFTAADKIANIFVPYAIVILCNSVSLKFFRV